MRFIFQLFLSFLVPILVDSTVYSPNSPTICLTETNKGCQEQMKKKNQTLESVNDNFPPLKALMKNYTEQCQNVMKCASGLECFKGKSEKAIFQTSCDEVGIRRYGFDYNCMAPILERVYQEDYNCTKDFGYKILNLTVAQSLFKSEKQCFLTIARNACDTTNYNFFLKNYDEIVEVYTSRPVPDNSFCASPSDKFHRLQCEKLDGGFMTKATSIHVLSVNLSNPVVQDVVEISEAMEKCMQESCWVFNEDEKNSSKVFTDTFQALPANLTNVFKLRPRLLEYKCLANMSFYDFYHEQMSCVRINEAPDCFMFTITKFCREEILADFENLEVSMGPNNQYNSPEFAFSMFKDNKKKRRFVITMNNEKVF
ncbi:hypothetical protein GCK72_020818 [Caenorhabditis remanei]|uniref:T20D4.11-like domain-containing protein n=1 Tax=Caenorhabditis remanei TaxID=31234 RepID=A0A6A5GGB3_CAERE|nr:hypothetical protein GCK72_020818 [Caenorhabditis remanei]KAF1754258.1 hypothetical protein GCK72_020818 [Caenorhabditis remanei]